MYKYYLFITGLGILVLALSVQVFSIAGTPFSQQLIKLDNNRLSEFNEIKYKIESYYSTNKKLPSDLKELKDLDSKLSIIDPKTKSEYNYKTISNSQYELCTEFSVDSKENTDRTYSHDKISYNKGYDCISYTVPDYILNSRQSISSSPSSYNALTQVAQANNTQRRSDTNAILNATQQYMADNKGVVPGVITTSEQEISKSGADLCSIVVPSYIAALPVDPIISTNDYITDCATSYSTGYTIMKDAKNMITVKAPHAEGDTIYVTR